MKHVSPLGTEVCDPTFAEQIREISGVSFERCYQCFTCSLSCPVSSAMDFLPNQIARITQLGLKNLVLSSSTIWLCAACETCVTRCPHDVDLPRLMSTLRQLALEEKSKGRETSIPIFHQSFMKNIKQYGRQHEIAMLLQLKLKTRDLFSDLGLGIKIIRKGKLKLLPPKFKWVKEIRDTFRNTEQGAQD